MPFFLVSKRFRSALSQFTEYRADNEGKRCLSCPERARPSPEVRVHAVSQKCYREFFILTSLTKGIVCTIVRKCLPIVHRAPRSVIHSHTTIIVDSIMFGWDRRERDRAAVTAAKLESTYGARIISEAVIYLTLMCSIFLSCHINT